MTPTPKRPLFSTFVIAAISLASPFLSSSAHADLVTNGGFEYGYYASPLDPSGNGGVAVGGGTTQGYQVDLPATGTVPGSYGWNTGPRDPTTGDVTAVLVNNLGGPAYFLNSPGGGPHGGYVAAVFTDGTYQSYITQVLTGLTIGQTYRLGYWISNQIGDAPSTTTSGPDFTYNSLTVALGGNDTGTAITGATNIFGPVQLQVPLGWTYETQDFVASGSTSIRLSFIGGSNTAGDLLDDVSVVAVPESSSFGVLMGAALLAFGTAARFRRRSVAMA